MHGASDTLSSLVSSLSANTAQLNTTEVAKASAASDATGKRHPATSFTGRPSGAAAELTDAAQADSSEAAVNTSDTTLVPADAAEAVMTDAEDNPKETAILSDTPDNETDTAQAAVLNTVGTEAANMSSDTAPRAVDAAELAMADKPDARATAASLPDTVAGANNAAEAVMADRHNIAEAGTSVTAAANEVTDAVEAAQSPIIARTAAAEETDTAVGAPVQEAEPMQSATHGTKEAKDSAAVDATLSVSDKGASLADDLSLNSTAHPAADMPAAGVAHEANHESMARSLPAVLLSDAATAATQTPAATTATPVVTGSSAAIGPQSESGVTPAALPLPEQGHSSHCDAYALALPHAAPATAHSPVAATHAGISRQPVAKPVQAFVTEALSLEGLSPVGLSPDGLSPLNAISDAAAKKLQSIAPVLSTAARVESQAVNAAVPPTTATAVAAAESLSGVADAGRGEQAEASSAVAESPGDSSIAAEGPDQSPAAAAPQAGASAATTVEVLKESLAAAEAPGEAASPAPATQAKALAAAAARSLDESLAAAEATGALPATAKQAKASASTTAKGQHESPAAAETPVASPAAAVQAETSALTAARSLGDLPAAAKASDESAAATQSEAPAVVKPGDQSPLTAPDSAAASPFEYSPSHASAVAPRPALTAAGLEKSAGYANTGSQSKAAAPIEATGAESPVATPASATAEASDALSATLRAAQSEAQAPATALDTASAAPAVAANTGVPVSEAAHSDVPAPVTVLNLASAAPAVAATRVSSSAPVPDAAQRHTSAPAVAAALPAPFVLVPDAAQGHTPRTTLRKAPPAQLQIPGATADMADPQLPSLPVKAAEPQSTSQGEAAPEHSPAVTTASERFSGDLLPAAEAQERTLHLPKAAPVGQGQSYGDSLQLQSSQIPADLASPPSTEGAMLGNQPQSSVESVESQRSAPSVQSEQAAPSLQPQSSQEGAQTQDSVKAVQAGKAIDETQAATQQQVPQVCMCHVQVLHC